MRISVLLAVATTVLSGPVFAQTGPQLLDGVRNDARQQAQSSQSLPYNGSLYGLPGQTQSASIMDSAVRSALGGLTSNCKQVGAIDLTKLPSNLTMDVSGILSNTAVQVPNINSSATTPVNAAASLPSSPAQTPVAPAGTTTASAAPAVPSAAPSVKPTISRIWGLSNQN